MRTDSSPDARGGDLDRRAHELLGRLTGRVDASFHGGQLEAIRALVGARKRVLVVQRTGWGKSAVYFIATRLLRDEGSGPTLVVSPLLALMRNQIAAAGRMGVRADTINSSNPADWPGVVARLEANELDLLVISPERLANREFRETVLNRVGAIAGLVVIDEAHCISDWGHDFRPDYRRIRRVLDLLPSTVPVLGCTATANDRVVNDVIAQLGDDIEVFRGPLARDGLSLQVISLAAPASRMAWLAENLPKLPGSGIVYCLTKRDAEAVTLWLQNCGISARIYTGDSEGREDVERALLDNEIDVVVATSALGMGFDKPDLTYVIHFQAPGSVISYYQQVGRAGRQLSASVGVLLRGSEDEDIQDWFITNAFPTALECRQVLDALEQRDDFVKLTELEAAVNVKPSRIEMLMKNLEVDGIVVADGKKYMRTPNPFSYDAARVEAITALRRHEQEEMVRYGRLTGECRMVFLGAALDDPGARRCGICDVCAGPSLPTDVDEALARKAVEFLRRRPVIIEPRKQWPDRRRIPVEHQNGEGRALCRWGDGGWSESVKRGKQVEGHFSDELVEATAKLVRTWRPDPAPEWVAWVPTLTNPELVAGFARRLAAALGLPVVEAVSKTRHTEPQKMMENSAQQFRNIDGAFAVRGPVTAGPVLLVDDMVDSRWTLTYVGMLLQAAGCPAVLPLALADTGQS
ncbi:MAG TPA: RecQ family ATP-dependent DNA helicase [Acidimicrobiia bacterium]|nr:RecQ family ATP-dependent DNA helicase [Acidimicrobiia bacterium]